MHVLHQQRPISRVAGSKKCVGDSGTIAEVGHRSSSQKKKEGKKTQGYQTVLDRGIGSSGGGRQYRERDHHTEYTLVG